MSIRKLPGNDVIYELYVNQKRTTREICDIYGVKSISNLHVQLKKMGVETRKCAGEHHHSWKGGRVSKGDGYYGIWMPNHERADKQGYVYEHTLVVEKQMKRLPNKGEVVHHIDLDKLNNDISNLYVCGHKEHSICHRSIERLIKPLLEREIIRFEEGVYILND